MNYFISLGKESDLSFVNVFSNFCCCAQVESAMAMRSLQPQIKAIQQRYAGDQVKLCILFKQRQHFYRVVCYDKSNCCCSLLYR